MSVDDTIGFMIDEVESRERMLVLEKNKLVNTTKELEIKLNEKETMIKNFEKQQEKLGATLSKIEFETEEMDVPIKKEFNYLNEKENRKFKRRISKRNEKLLQNKSRLPKTQKEMKILELEIEVSTTQIDIIKQEKQQAEQKKKSKKKSKQKKSIEETSEELEKSIKLHMQDTQMNTNELQLLKIQLEQSSKLLKENKRVIIKNKIKKNEQKLNLLTKEYVQFCKKIIELESLAGSQKK